MCMKEVHYLKSDYITGNGQTRGSRKLNLRPLSLPRCHRTMKHLVSASETQTVSPHKSFIRSPEMCFDAVSMQFEHP